jgi:hypothetical protein
MSFEKARMRYNKNENCDLLEGEILNNKKSYLWRNEFSTKDDFPISYKYVYIKTREKKEITAF